MVNSHELLTMNHEPLTTKSLVPNYLRHSACLFLRLKKGCKVSIFLSKERCSLTRKGFEINLYCSTLIDVDRNLIYVASIN